MYTGTYEKHPKHRPFIEHQILFRVVWFTSEQRPSLRTDHFSIHLGWPLLVAFTVFVECSHVLYGVIWGIVGFLHLSSFHTEKWTQKIDNLKWSDFGHGYHIIKASLTLVFTSRLHLGERYRFILKNKDGIHVITSCNLLVISHTLDFYLVSYKHTFVVYIHRTWKEIAPSHRGSLNIPHGPFTCFCSTNPTKTW